MGGKFWQRRTDKTCSKNFMAYSKPESADELEPHGSVTISPLAPENVFSSCHERGTKKKF